MPITARKMKIFSVNVTKSTVSSVLPKKISNKRLHFMRIVYYSTNILGLNFNGNGLLQSIFPRFSFKATA